MTAWAYYNENDPNAAAWLRELIKDGHIAPGVVDGRSIEDVAPDELFDFDQCHFFAGIGAWSYALRSAGWPDGRPVWTASLPCQPFSAAGGRAGFADERHLWPVFLRLLTHGKPRSVPLLGEQVANRGGLAWFDLVSADLEGQGYAVGAVDTCAAGFGAPHIRQRLYWLADADGAGRQPRPHDAGSEAARDDARREGFEWQPCTGSDHGGLADAEHAERWPEPEPDEDTHRGPRSGRRGVAGGERPGPVNGSWRDADWLLCRDNKWRPVEPGSFPLAHGAAARVGRLRGYGNSIVVPQATAFVTAAMDALW
jgi:DNA (cytosine-5)-methyltransferase 1